MLSSPAPRFPLLFPGEPPFRAPYLVPLRPAGERGRLVTAATSGERRKAGYVSVMERALAAEEEYRRARAEVLRKGVELEGYAIEGISIGGHETCVIVPSLNVAFDIGDYRHRIVPEVAFTGDTTSDFILEPRNADALRAKGAFSNGKMMKPMELRASF
ncbi:hypothetical protein J5N97_026333 [Dioscorea zingiberensis]|uniref:Uncharacterized protein n=1 Tax=Dioscorea zingiberensis TaxID=325984 RepID=A0A9D5C277_9LILI|nr:hypothetical protein J5N97_026333 [Dioscorea zingiberensis]